MRSSGSVKNPLEYNFMGNYSGGSDTGGDAARAQIYVPAGDGTAGPTILRRKSANCAARPDEFYFRAKVSK